MPTLEQKPEGDHALTTEDYILRNFDRSDRIAVLVLNGERDTKVQRVVTAEALATERWQAWLRAENARGANVYISYNALRADTRNRTKSDVAAIRHVYLDLDKDGERSLAAIQASKEIPQPNYVLSTSPGKYQVIWKVEGMGQYQAEMLQKRMVEAFGGDPAATDSTRVLRLPGFNNKKYQQDYRVKARELSTATYRLSDFKLGEQQAQTPEHAAAPPYSHRPGVTAKRTPSDHDWRWAQDRLRSGESIAVLIQRLVDYRYDKPQPQYYARRTVTRAYARVAISRGDNPEAIVQAIREYAPNQHESGEQYARQTVQEFIAKLGKANENQESPGTAAQQQAQQLSFEVTP
ncbi:MAG TPA: DNA-primase RepB domain-containing protein [Terriglobia bacterium]|nr:DNA-primase RepB domain-containing protein [Terriglobia bacterium]